MLKLQSPRECCLKSYPFRCHTKGGEIYEHGGQNGRGAGKTCIFRNIVSQGNETLPKYIHQKLQLESQLGRITIR